MREIEFTRQKMDIRGVSVSEIEAEPPRKAFALFTDLLLTTIVFFLTGWALRDSPVPHPRWVIFFAAEYFTLRVTFRLALRATLGERIWGIKVLDNSLARVGFVPTVQSPDNTQMAIGFFLSFFIFLMAFWVMSATWFSNPILNEAVPWNTESSFPADPNQYVVAPFFYSLGAWPRYFNHQPVFYSLPYQKGPPFQFVGKIVARWDMPDIRMTWEGPRTPARLPEELQSPEALKKCILSIPFGTDIMSCLRAREQTLLRHIEEMRSVAPKTWSIKWLEVANPGVPWNQRPRGIYLSAQGKIHAQDRFILITAKGTHQTFILEYTMNSSGSVARDLFQDSLRTLRVSDQLTPGIDWVGKQLENVKLDELKNLPATDEVFARLSEIEAFLVSKISVDPKTFDSYYHLGGVASLLVKNASKRQQIDWTASARPMIDSLYLYAKDIAPNDPRVAQLQTLAMEARRF